MLIFYNSTIMCSLIRVNAIYYLCWTNNSIFHNFFCLFWFGFEMLLDCQWQIVHSSLELIYCTVFFFNTFFWHCCAQSIKKAVIISINLGLKWKSFHLPVPFEIKVLNIIGCLNCDTKHEQRLLVTTFKSGKKLIKENTVLFKRCLHNCSNFSNYMWKPCCLWLLTHVAWNMAKFHLRALEYERLMVGTSEYVWRGSMKISPLKNIVQNGTTIFSSCKENIPNINDAKCYKTINWFGPSF